MDLQTVLNKVDSWPIEDRIRLVQEVWDRLAGQETELNLSDAMKAEIDRRLADHAADPTAAIPWEQVDRPLIRIASPRLARPEQVADFVMEVEEEPERYAGL